MNCQGPCNTRSRRLLEIRWDEVEIWDLRFARNSEVMHGTDVVVRVKLGRFTRKSVEADKSVSRIEETVEKNNISLGMKKKAMNVTVGGS